MNFSVALEGFEVTCESEWERERHAYRLHAALIDVEVGRSPKRPGFALLVRRYDAAWPFDVMGTISAFPVQDGPQSID